MPCCYSESNSVLFIHYPKAGGFSVDDYLRRCIPDITRRGLHTRHHYARHIENLTGHDPLAFDCLLCVVRNPYAVQVSRYHYWHQEYEQGKRYPHARLAHSLTFNQWLRHERSGHGPYEYHKWYRIGDSDPPNLCIIKLENLADELPKAVAPYASGKLPTIKHLNESNHDDWRKYYDAASKAIVQAKYPYTFTRFYDPSEV